MCGILGCIGFEIDSESFKLCLDSIIHRGPDGFGVYENCKFNLKLGHRRLAIIDVDARSNQPFIMADRFILIYNGEIYNYIEIRNYLISKGCKFVTESDTEVLLQLLVVEGPDGLNRCNGMWSFALFDKEEGSLLLARDRLGKKPLYYHESSGNLVFCSEMKGIYPFLKSVDYSVDYIEQSMIDVMSVESRSDCLVKGIKKFPAGSYGIYRDSRLTITQYYNPAFLLLEKEANINYNEAIDEFRELFMDSCKLRMRSDVPSGTALSGGIDSSLLISTLANSGFHHSNSYEALIASLPGSELNETSDAILVAQNAGISYQTIDIKPHINDEIILWNNYQFEDIASTAPFPFIKTYQSFRDRGVFVTLDGHGADELFGGYSADLYSKLEDDFPNIFKMRRTLQLLNDIHGIDNRYPIGHVLPYFKGHFSTILRTGKLSNIFCNNAYRRRLFHSTFHGILPTLLRNYDKYSMQAGVEVRMPFLDYRIVEFAFKLNSNFKIRDGYTKALLRSAGKGIVPEKILRNKVKIGWSSPMGEWLKGDLRDWFLDEINSVDFINCNLVNSKTYRDNAMEYLNSERVSQNEGLFLWLNLQPYLIEKANKRFAKVLI